MLLSALLACASGCTPPAAAPEPVDHEERALAKANAAWADMHARRGDATFSPANVRRFAPYSATLDHDVWTVRGTRPPGFVGEMPAARIRATDGVTTIESTRE